MVQHTLQIFSVRVLGSLGTTLLNEKRMGNAKKAAILDQKGSGKVKG